MLSDEFIEKLIQPIIDRQEAINIYVIRQIALRIKEIGKLKPSDVYKLEQLYKSGADVRRINKELAVLTGLQIKDIKSMVRNIAVGVYLDAKPFYDYRHLPYIKMAKNKPIMRIVRAIEKQTVGSYINLSNSSAFMIRDLKNPKILKPTPIAKIYQTVIDEAIQAVQTGVVDYGTAMRRTMQQLVDSGIRNVEYHPESGRRYTKRLDSAVRQNLLDSVRQISQAMQDEVGKQFNADGKELSAHPYSAPDHEPFQGLQFTNAQFDNIQTNNPFEDIEGQQFPAVERIIGQWNCRHVAWSIIIGASKPNYSKEQLAKWRKENAKGYTLPNGKHLTMYECTQRQRQLETQIRKAKDGQIAAKAAGDMELAKKYQAEINKDTKEYKMFSQSCGLQEATDRMRVSGYRKIRAD